jgi:ABC-type lipoprotein export system ATPase subunit
MTGPRVVGDHLGHRYHDGPWLFRGLDLRLEAGGVTALTGPSGTGKSTLLAILAGTTTPAEGRVSRDDVWTTTSIAQSPHGVPGRTALDHITLPYLAAGLPRAEAEERARPIAALFHIEHLLMAPYRELSGGEAQRLMLARATAQEGDLILADEPTANLDVNNARGVIDVLGGLAAGGAVVVVATHDQLARQACDEVIDLAGAVR